MSKHLSRRGFGTRIAAAAAAASGMSPLAVKAQGMPKQNFYQFPASFRWGCATAAYQIEGGAKDGGRGPSIWDTFSHTPGKVYQNQNGDVADDDYHRYKEDIQLLKSLEATIYRFSVSWPRIFPEGTGQPNEQGVDFYRRVVDQLRANDIEPFCTLFHWDLPQALQDKYGGWQSRETSKAFAEYAGYVAQRLSDRIQHFFTMNEFSSFIDLGYGEGRFAPGLRLAPKELNQTRFNAVLAHGLAVQAIRAKAKPGTKVGLAENLRSGAPVIEAEPHIKASAQATRLLNAQYVTVIMEGKYPDEFLTEAGANVPKYTPEDLKIIGSPLDLLGLNIYNPTYIRADDSPRGFAVVPNPSSFPHMASPWLYVGPEGLYWAPRHVSEIWNIKDIYITENGCSSSDVLTPDGHIYDTDRVMFLRNYLISLHRAVSEGFPVNGYFLWSLMDNFEWADGYSKRFGIYYVDYETQKRIPKLSAFFYRDTIKQNAVL
ncbi:MAG TPA: GH1 family beta-glucosidase [Bryobacteraceae bacterium]|jgi:beta-glucosidase|nr:GH1 family beta-glucosidase [Bryobacteraceae bacterium]